MVGAIQIVFHTVHLLTAQHLCQSSWLSGKLAGVEQIKVDLIYDCVDKTEAFYWDNKLKRWEGKDGKQRRWHKWGTLHSYLFIYFTEWDKGINRLSKICNGEKVEFPIISPSSFSKFEKRGQKKKLFW